MNNAKVLHHTTYSEHEKDELVEDMRAAWKLKLYTRVTSTMITTWSDSRESGFMLEMSDEPFPNPTEDESPDTATSHFTRMNQLLIEAIEMLSKTTKKAES